MTSPAQPPERHVPFGASPSFGSAPPFGSNPNFGIPTSTSFGVSAPLGACLGEDCGQTVQALYPFLDGELPVEQHTFVLDHLRQCPSCGAAFGFEHQLRTTVRRKLVDLPPPPSLADRIRHAIRNADGNE
jgi:mycothiol system anti-sigma-R factor